MREIVSSVTSKGQVTIPAEVRKHLGLKAHDRISFIIEENGCVRLKVPRYPNIASVAGAAGSLRQPLSGQQRREIATEDYLVARNMTLDQGVSARRRGT